MTQKNIIVQEQKIPITRLILNQLGSPLIYILILAGIITFFLEEYSDSAIILIAVFVNTALGFYQEYKAENTLRQLKKLVTQKAIILKDGKRNIVDASEVRVGDILEINTDYQIPADGIIIETSELTINEAVLTGESMPVQKKRSDKVFAGTNILSGIATIKITTIGAQTKMGMIGEEVSSLSESKTPLQTQLSNLARSISLVVLASTVLLFIIGLIFEYSLKEIFTTSVAVAVASIPEGLVITLTVILTVGMQRISRRKAVVRKLLAAETLGSVTTICVDKTGTITEGDLSVTDANFVDEKMGYYSILLCNNHIDPLEISMSRWFKKLDAKNKPGIEDKHERLAGIPFNSKHKFTATLNKFGNENIIFVFGAPEVLLQKTNLNKKEKETWEEKVIEYAKQSKRVIGFGYKEVSKEKTTLDFKDIEDLEWNGLLTFNDPIRKGIKQTFKHCKEAGINVQMITGDYLETAKSVALEIGLLDESVDKSKLDKYILTGQELEKLSDKELSELILDIKVFARIDPFQKLRLVKALQSKGEVVSMTGDGVNDAPALKAADIGIAVNEASDVSKEISDIVLLDSNFNTIVHAIEEGRAIFDNIKKVVLYLLSDSFSELVLIIGAIVLKLPIPITAVQILWINLIEDSLPALSLAFEPKEGDVLKLKPRSKNASILDSKMRTIIATCVALNAVALLGIFSYLNRSSDDLELIRTFIFASLGFNSLIYIFACKSLRRNIFSYNPFNNTFMLAAVCIGIILLMVGIYVPFFNTFLETKPLDVGYWIPILLLGVFNLLTIEGVKWFMNRDS